MPDPHSTKSESAAGTALDVGILFVDLVDSSVFASVMDLHGYAGFIDSFHRTCVEETRYFFGDYLEGRYQEGRDYQFGVLGDEFVVYLHTGRAHNDIYLLTCLAVMLKAVWLAAPTNVARVARRTAPAELSCGIHFGPVWAVPRQNGGHDFCGYAINLAKRIESQSRAGRAYRVFLSDQAFKEVHYRQRNLLFGPRLRLDAKGIFGANGTYELVHTFLNPGPRIPPARADGLRVLLADHVRNTSPDLWIHDLFQVWSEVEADSVTNEAMELCRRVLRQSPHDPVALYHLAHGSGERGDHRLQVSLLRDLVAAWPHFGDGHLELGNGLRALGRQEEALEAFTRAALLGITEAETALRREGKS